MNPEIIIAHGQSAGSGGTFLGGLWNLLGTFHPATVHFPVAAVIIAAFFLVLRKKWENISEDVPYFCLLVAAITAPLAMLMGWAFALQLGYKSVFEAASPSQRGLLLHRWAGVALAALTVGTAILALMARRRKSSARLAFLWKAGVFASAALAGLVGHLGGTLTHGDIVPDAWEKLWHTGQEEAEETVEGRGAEEVGFMAEIRPILEGRCLRCHGEEKQRSGFRLDTKESAFLGGDIAKQRGEAAIVPGQSDKSRLLWMIQATSDDFDKEIYPMPPASDDRLNNLEASTLKRWIEEGAPWPDGVTLEASH